MKTYLRTVLRPPVQGVSDHHRLGVCHDALQELVVNGLLDEYPAGGDAVLALVEEHAAHRSLHGLVEVAVAKDDERGLAPELKRHLLEVRLGTRFHNGVAYLGAAGESQFTNLFMVRKFSLLLFLITSYLLFNLNFPTCSLQVKCHSPSDGRLWLGRRHCRCRAVR